MKKLTLAIAFCSISVATLKAQSGRKAYSCPKLYMGVSTGLENPSGLIGFNVDVPITQNFSLGTGVGLSSWGYKAYGEGRFILVNVIVAGR